MDNLIALDYSIFEWINLSWKNEFLDLVMPYIRNKFFWAPLYLYILIFLWSNYKFKGVYIIILLIIAIVLSDQLSSSIIKPLIQRIRPCNDASIMENVRLLISCGPGYSFTSSHAANHFTIAAFISLSVYSSNRWLVITLFLSAVSVGLAQIYVGVHYPFDILGGALLGMLIGFLIWLVSIKIALQLK